MMKTRCTNSKCLDYKDYGGRGIKICERWMKSFQDFLSDMGPRPPGMTLERVDTNGNYCPENCVWATHKTEARNNRRNKLSVIEADLIRIAYAMPKRLDPTDPSSWPRPLRGVSELARAIGVSESNVGDVLYGRS
jgi:hypothetical protein